MSYHESVILEWPWPTGGKGVDSPTHDVQYMVCVEIIL